MRYIKIAVVAAIAATAIGCSWRRTPVPVLSDSQSTAALVGEWSGEYSSTETGRSGSITFSLASERDTAYGDVVMVPRVRAVQIPIQPRQEVTGPTPQNQTEPLRIRFVRMEGGLVSGLLDPYNDPECGCRVVTAYEGRFTDANTIEGSYTTRGTDLFHKTTGGRWKVTRQNPKSTTP